MSDEINFAKTILNGRAYRDVPDDEVLSQAEQLLSGWMSGETRMERPKLYDHYAMVFAALLRQVRALEARVAALEARATPTDTPESHH